MLRQFSIQQSSAILYHRAIIEGIVYTTTSYMCLKVKTDCVLCFKRSGLQFFGISKHHASFCTTDCSGCLKPCKHCLYHLTATQNRSWKHCFERHTCASYFLYKVWIFVNWIWIILSEIQSKCMDVKFGSSEERYIVELPDKKEKNLWLLFYCKYIQFLWRYVCMHAGIGICIINNTLAHNQ